MMKKRARTEDDAATHPDQQSDDVNPVYPYDAVSNTPALMPPFYNSSDFTGTIGGSLSLKVMDPLQRTVNGLGLKLGSGLAIDTDGRLSASASDFIHPTPPLFNENGNFFLKYSSPLSVTGDSLSLTVGQGLEISDDKLAISYVTEYPLTIERNTIKLKYGTGLQLQNNTLEVIPYSVTSPLTYNSANNTLALSFSSPLLVENNSLTMKFQAPLTVSNPTTTPTVVLQTDNGLKVEDGKLMINVGEGFTFNNTQLQTNLSPPLLISGGKITLGLQDALVVKGNNLTMNVTSPLKYLNQQLQLGVGAGLAVNAQDQNLTINTGQGLNINNTNSQLSVNAGPGFKFESNQLQLNIGAGLSIENNVLKSTISSTSAPLSINNQVLSLGVGNGLITSNNLLTVNVGNGIKIENSKVTSNITATAPLTMTNNSNVGINIGSGLQVVNNALTAVGGEDWTLWTGINTTNNVPSSSSGPGSLFLQLHRLGGCVYGYVTYEGTSIATDRTTEITLKFSSNGRLDTAASSLKTFGWVYNTDYASYDSGNGLDPRKMLPNTGVYTQYGYEYTKLNIWTVGVENTPTGRKEYWVPVEFFASYNRDIDSSHPFSITLKWVRDSGYALGVNKFTTATFVYVANNN